VIFARPAFALGQPAKVVVTGGLGIAVVEEPFAPPTLVERPQPSVAQPGQLVAGVVDNPYLDVLQPAVGEVVEFVHPDKVVEEVLESIPACTAEKKVDWPLNVQTMANLTRRRRNPLDTKNDFFPGA
jgi:hypothetical protein